MTGYAEVRAGPQVLPEKQEFLLQGRFCRVHMSLCRGQKY